MCILFIFYNIYYNSNMSNKRLLGMISTVIINAQKQDRDKIASLLSAQDGIKVLACGRDGYDALKLISSLKPDVAIMDNQLEFIEGEEIPPLLKARSPSTAVVILAARISDHQLHKAASNAVSGFVYKEKEMELLPGILKCISEGGCFISPLFAARILRLLSADRAQVKVPARQYTDAKFPPGEDPTRYLSKMELRILAGIGEGHNSGEIARNLNLAVGTVRNYISSVMHKTGLHNRSQMARYAFYYGLVPLYNETL